MKAPSSMLDQNNCFLCYTTKVEQEWTSTYHNMRLLPKYKSLLHHIYSTYKLPKRKSKNISFLLCYVRNSIIERYAPLVIHCYKPRPKLTTAHLTPISLPKLLNCSAIWIANSLQDIKETNLTKIEKWWHWTPGLSFTARSVIYITP